MMKYIFILIHFYIIPTFSENIKPNLCVNCKFFRKEYSLLSSNKFGKCSAFPEVNKSNNDDEDYLVTGIKYNKPKEYTYCSIARKYDSMCGKEGKYYEEKEGFKKWIKNLDNKTINP